MKALPLILSALFMGFASAETPEEKARAVYEAAYLKACDQMEAKYPDARNETSQFSILLTHRVRLASARGDAAISDPNFILKYADEVAAELEAIGEPVTKPDKVAKAPALAQSKLSPAPAPRPAPTLSPEAQDVQNYLDKVARGEAGVNPRLQTQARSGDPFAQAAVDRQHALNALQAQVNAGQLDVAGEAAERLRIQQAYDAAIASIQMYDLTYEIERLTREMERRRQNGNHGSQRARDAR